MRYLIVLMILMSGLIAQDHEYVGSTKCKSCHKKAESGDQWNKWLEGPHAGAFETLKSDAALKIGKERGLTTTPDKAPECVVCHTTGFDKGGYAIMDDEFWAQTTSKGKPTKEVKLMKALQSVGCENCHGPGSDYKSKKVMMGITDGSIDGASVGLVKPVESTCKGCHNENSPSYKGFDFAEMYKKIAHESPEG